MHDKPTLEQRLELLEHEVDQIKRHLERPSPETDWLERRSGSMKDYPEFEEVIRLGREASQLMDRTAD